MMSTQPQGPSNRESASTAARTPFERTSVSRCRCIHKPHSSLCHMYLSCHSPSAHTSNAVGEDKRWRHTAAPDVWLSALGA